MKISTYVNAKADAGSLTLSLNGPGSITLIGSSCPASACSGSEYLSSVSFAPHKGTEAVVAIDFHVQDEKGRGVYNDNHLIRLFWENERLKVDLESPFVPNCDRLGQIQHKDDLTVLAGEQRFTSPFIHLHEFGDDKKTEKLITAGHRIVKNPDLLCRFLVGQATLEDLEAAATLDKRSQTERELARTKVALNGALDEISRLKQELAVKTDFTADCRSLLAVKIQYRDELEAYRGGNKFTEKMAMSDLGVSFAELRVRSAEIKAILTNEVEHQTLFGFLPWVKVRKIKKVLGLNIKWKDLPPTQN